MKLVGASDQQPDSRSLNLPLALVHTNRPTALRPSLMLLSRPAINATLLRPQIGIMTGVESLARPVPVISKSNRTVTAILVITAVHVVVQTAIRTLRIPSVVIELGHITSLRKITPTIPAEKSVGSITYP